MIFKIINHRLGYKVCNHARNQDLLKKVTTTSSIRLKPVSRADYMFLYELLAEREPRINISHKKTPTYSEHVKYVMSKPYSRWYTVLFGNKKAGMVYLTRKNEIGIFIKKEFHGKKIGQVALKLLIRKNPRRSYYANINPKNKKSIKFFKNNGFSPMQYTYELSLTQQERN